MNKLIVFSLFGLVITSCQKEQNPGVGEALELHQSISLPAEIGTNRHLRAVEYNTFYGPVVQMGEGFARSWINITHDEQPLAIGIEMTEGALVQNHPEGEHSHSNAFVLQLHQKAKALTPFDHIGLNWNAAGHPPPGIYTVPHLDLHFYMMPLQERLMIPSYPEAMTAFNLNPPEGYIPLGYVKSPGGEAKMGAHWMDVTSPEFHGQPFTHTFVYGSYNGAVTFFEPMITTTTLQSGVTVQKEIRQPQYFSPSNTYYPGSYSIWKDGNKHYVSMEGFTWR